jgi:lysozyme family protein
VRSLQENLSKAGFPVEPDGLYGPGTGAAVKQFQQQVGLVADGIVRESTRKALSELLNEPRVLQLTQPYQRGEDVAAIQRALLKAGFDLTIDGVYGPAMAAAVRQFQEEEALPVDGMVDAATRKQLNEFLSGPPESEKPLVYYLTKNLAHGEKLQRFLNRFPDIALKEDGYLGCATSAAFRQVTGYPLQFAVCFSNLKAEYVTLFKQCKIREDKLSGIDATLTKIKANQARYESVAVMVGIPWFFIAVIHALEAALNFEKHLHNGDPLTSKTLNVPKGRPATGVPPFTWEESALDAMNLKGFKASQDWSLASLLFRLEAYNGWGYRRYHPEVLSPYLWSGSYSYTQGKYAADGVWDPELVSQQFGAAVLLRRMVDKGLIRIDQKTPPDAVPATPPFVFYSNTKIVYGDTLQQFLNEFPGIALSVDGYPGPKTSEAFQQVTGYYLSGDPRNRPGVAARITQFFNRLRSV